MALTTSGIGSGLDVDGLVAKLMAAEAAPLAKYDKKSALYQGKLDAFNKLSAAIGAFQTSLGALTAPATFRAVSASVSDDKVLKAGASAEAVPGNYKIKVSKLAQAQTLNSAGVANMTAMIGSGAKTTLTFQFGTVTGGQYGMAGGALAAGVASGGIANGSLTINGTAIATSGATRSAGDLAEAINAQSATTGVTAMAARTETSATLFGGTGTPNFGNVSTGAGSSYTLSVGGVQLAAQGAGVGAGSGVTAATIDATLAGTNATTNALAAANISFTGSAANGDLRFFAADGSNITISETVAGTVAGGIAHAAGSANNGSTVTASSTISLTSTAASPITVGGSNPALAGLTAGSGGAYLGAGFSQDGTKPSGTVVLEAGDQSLAGIRDAINKANIGVQASIVSDGSASPYRLVLTSTKTGASSSMKISLSGDGVLPADPGLANLLAYDPAGTQSLKQTSAAQSALLDVNGVAVTSDSNTVSEAIQGVSLTLSQVGSSNVTIAKDSATVKNSVESFVKAYNDLNRTIKTLTNYDAESKKGGVLVGDATVRSVQSQLRAMLGTTVGSGKLTNLSQIGIAFQKDGSLAVDSTKLNKAMTDNFQDIAGMFAAIGTASDNLVKFTSSTAKTEPGTYAINLTQVASKGSLTSTSALPPTTVIATNTTWTVTLNQTEPATASKTANISLPAGSYTPAELSALVRAAINGNAGFAENGDTVEAAIDASGKLSLSSTRWGGGSNISVSSLTGTTVDTVFGGAAPVTGTDVAGTIGGYPATGSGQTLTAAAGSRVDGLKIEVTGGAIGDRGTITFSQGYAYQLNNLATALMGKDGTISGKTDGLNSSIKSVASERERFGTRLEQIEKRYRAQFTALDAMLASMQATSNYLTQQLASLAANS